MVAVSILHIFPAHADAAIPAYRFQIVRRIRSAGSFRNNRCPFPIRPRPCAVYRSHAGFIGFSVRQLSIAERFHFQAVRGNTHRFHFPAISDFHLVTGNIGLCFPCQSKRPVPARCRQYFGNIKRGFRNTFFHIIQKFHFGNFRQASSICRSCNPESHFFYGNLAAQVDFEQPLAAAFLHRSGRLHRLYSVGNLDAYGFPIRFQKQFPAFHSILPHRNQNLLHMGIFAPFRLLLALKVKADLHRILFRNRSSLNGFQNDRNRCVRQQC